MKEANNRKTIPYENKKFNESKNSNPMKNIYTNGINRNFRGKKSPNNSNQIKKGGNIADDSNVGININHSLMALKGPHGKKNSTNKNNNSKSNDMSSFVNGIID